MKKFYLFFYMLLACSSESSTVEPSRTDQHASHDSDAPSHSSSNQPSNAPDATVTDQPGAVLGALGASCATDAECDSSVCNYNHKCVANNTCRMHLGGDTCGSHEVGDKDANHEDCCKSILVSGYIDPTNPTKKVYLDKYEITSGRVQAWIEQLALKYGKPNVKQWISDNKPSFWSNDWNKWLPSDFIDDPNDNVKIPRLNLGDPRHDGISQSEAPVGVIVPPTTDQVVNVGFYNQFTSSPFPFLDTHGNNLYVGPGQYGFPTFWYSPEVLKRSNQTARQDALDNTGTLIPAKDWLAVKSMNGITSALAEAFCAYEGGMLQTIEVFDYITKTNSPINVAACGVNHMNHANLLGGSLYDSFVDGSSLIPATKNINFSFDAGFALPSPDFVLNKQNYHFPDIQGDQTTDKAWQIAAPGRMVQDAILIPGNNEPFMDLCGNVAEQVSQTTNGKLNGKFAIRGFGIGIGSEFSDLDATNIDGTGVLRIEHPEAKSALTGFRCQYVR